MARGADGPRKDRPLIPTARFVFLGASNVALTRPSAVAAAARRVRGPAEFFFADGFGRSYVGASNVLGRVLPAIPDGGLFEALASGGTDAWAIVGDVGNDLAYGRDVETIAHAVAGVLDRLRALGARAAICGLPVPVLERCPKAGFVLFRTLFFPGRGIDRAEILGRVRRMDERLRAIADERELPFITPEPRWYGMDPIHPRRSLAAEIWERFLGAFGAELPAPRERPLDARIALRGALPAKRRIFGIEQETPQPCARLSDGSRVSLF